MRKVVHFIALLLFVLLPMQGRERGEPWLDELDAELAKKGEYDAQKEARIVQLRGRLRASLDDRIRGERLTLEELARLADAWSEWENREITDKETAKKPE